METSATSAQSNHLAQCGVFRTGTRGGACPMVVVSARGSVFYSPATRHTMLGCDVARSRDGGLSFQKVATPRDPQYVPQGYRPPRITSLSPAAFRQLSAELAPGVTLHPGLWLDDVTGRIFVTTTVKGDYGDGSGSVVAFSDDDDESWQASRTGEGSWDWGKLLIGSPATEASRQALAASGYPNVLYFTATGPTLISGPNQINYKSMDGGVSWTRLTDTFDRDKRGATGFPQRGVVTPDGAIYRPWAGTGAEYLPTADKSSIPVHIVCSFDEGQSWQHRELSGTRTTLLGAQIASDNEGTLYLAWSDSQDGQIRLTMSRDRAQTWSTPLVIRVPGVAWTSKPTLAVRAPGEIAIAYWGSDKAESTGDGWLGKDGRPYDGYITVCRDVRAPGPTFVSARARDGSAALLPEGESAMSSGEYIGAPSFAPDGSVWAGFLSQTEGGIAARLEPWGG